MLLPTLLDPPPWDSSDATRLKDFLTSLTGDKIFAFLHSSAPSFARTGSVREGYELAIQFIVDLTKHQPEVAANPPSSYPDLDDDKQWPKELQTEEVTVPTIAPKNTDTSNLPPEKNFNPV